MKQLIKRIKAFGIGLAGGFAFANRKKIKAEVDKLVKKGKLTAKDGKELFDKLVGEAKTIEQKVRKETKGFYKKAKTVSEKQTAALKKRIKELEAKLKAKKPKTKIKFVGKKKKPAKKK
ncbi:hypothetical protein GOV08_00635 [Candidatus Woesearchaeota archaeon]|nr:hypothetical protein [Candidatus Woesearchaeota archaeon]